MTAGKKECVTRRGVKKQKRFLLDSLRNLHRKFCTENDSPISYITFCQLRPFWVVEPVAKDRDTCVCVKHANMQLLVDKLHFGGIIKETSTEEICRAACCDATMKECMYGECVKCKSNLIPHLKATNDDELFYFKWITKKESRISAKDGQPIVVQVTKKEKVSASSTILIETINKELPDFKKHAYRVYHQMMEMKNLKRNLENNSCIIHIDFSENYACKYGMETQSVHFGASRNQATLHTGVIYYKDENLTEEYTLRHTSFCTISDSLRHDPSAIWAHLEPVFSEIVKNISNIETVHFWSDGPTTQYRNKKNFCIFAQLQRFHSSLKQATWNFSETGHGKGAADGIGGHLKRQADSLVAHGNDISTPEMFSNYFPKIKDLQNCSL